MSDLTTKLQTGTENLNNATQRRANKRTNRGNGDSGGSGNSGSGGNGGSGSGVPNNAGTNPHGDNGGNPPIGASNVDRIRLSVISGASGVDTGSNGGDSGVSAIAGDDRRRDGRSAPAEPGNTPQVDMGGSPVTFPNLVVPDDGSGAEDLTPTGRRRKKQARTLEREAAIAESYPVGLDGKTAAHILAMGFGAMALVLGPHWSKDSEECLPAGNDAAEIFSQLGQAQVEKIKKTMPWVSFGISMALLCKPSFDETIRIAKESANRGKQVQTTGFSPQTNAGGEVTSGGNGTPRSPEIFNPVTVASILQNDTNSNPFTGSY